MTGGPAYRREHAQDFDWLFREGGFDLRKAVVYSAILERPYT